MKTQVVLVTAPFLSVLRPPLGVSLLKAELAQRGIGALVEPLNVAFAETIGVEINEHVAETLPPHLLLGDWVFAAADRGRRGTEAEARYLESLADWLDDPRLPALDDLIDMAVAFVERAATRLAAHGADVVGFSTTFQQNFASLTIARRLKRLRPDTIICFGGANCEGPMGEALLEAYPFIDAVFSGEADDCFPDYVAKVLEQSKNHLGPVPRAVISGTTPVVLDDLPVPDFTDYFAALDATSYRPKVSVGLQFESSRGCWWGAKRHCRFCGLNGSNMTFRAKRPERVLEELQTLAARWGVKRFAAADNILGMKHITGVFGELERCLPGCSLFYEVKSNMTTPQLEILARGGMTWVQPGVESLDDVVLELMEKGVTALQNIRLLRDCAELGVAVTWNILAGFPGEMDEPYHRMAEMIPKLEHLDPPNSAGRLRLDRFSPYFERAAELGYNDVTPMPSYAVVYELPESLLRRIAYFFDGWSRPTVSDEALEPVRDAVGAWRRRMRDDPALLSLVEENGYRLVADTRSTSREPWTVLDDVDYAILSAVRDPIDVAVALRRLAEQWPADRVNAAFEQLTARDFVIVDGSRAVSVVVEASRRIHPPSAAGEPPLGRLIAPPDTLAEPVPTFRLVKGAATRELTV
jgi:magnesium-protoporphyrin IX monomethyl ester (oxidative) cyclase